MKLKYYQLKTKKWSNGKKVRFNDVPECDFKKTIKDTCPFCGFDNFIEHNNKKWGIHTCLFCKENFIWGEFLDDYTDMETTQSYSQE